MSSAWLCIPSARPSEEANRALATWRAQGYKIALFLDAFDQAKLCDKFVVGTYPGYAEAVNRLVKIVLAEEPACDWIVCAGDDTFPDPTKRADEIALEIGRHFGQYQNTFRTEKTMCSIDPPGVMHEGRFHWSTFGVMQPTGDRWGDTPQSRQQYGENRGAYIDRVAGSPWIGREFCLRVNGGNGPLWPGFYHMFVDQALQEMTESIGVFWQRRDLTHHHQHALRPREGEIMGRRDRLPAFLEKANSPEEWRKSKAEYERLKASNWEGYKP